VTTVAMAPRVFSTVTGGNAWISFANRRLGRLVVSLLVLMTAAFLMIHMVPGDPVRAALGMTTPVEVVDARRQALGLNDPLWTQYAHYLRGVVSGNFGTSMSSNLPVSKVIGAGLPATLDLAVSAFAVVMVVAIPVGLLMAVLTRGGRRRGGELAFTSTSVLLAAIPEFLLAVGLVYLFAVRLNWFPVAGRSGLDSYVLPVLSLAVGPTAVLARIVRVETLSVLGK
jgi:peptide/nickel transport system permease protein